MQTPVPLTQTFVYNCDGGYRLTVREEEKSLWLFFSSETRQLTSAPSDIGQRYTAPGIEFLITGEEAQLIIDEKNSIRCHNDRLAAIWEDAKFRKIEFRAAGNEPGWFAEVNREKIVFAGNYGQKLLIFPAVPAQRDDQLVESKYVTRAGDHSFNMTLQPGDCRDSMSGDLFDTRVTLKLDGQTLYGCGKSLH